MTIEPGIPTKAEARDLIEFHSSSFHSIMKNPRARTAKYSKTAQTYVRGIVDSIVFGYKPIVDVKQMQKGIRLEDDAIELYNEFYGTDYIKNTVPKGKIIKGECDIDDEDESLIIDVKVPWSKDTFPSTTSQINKVEYIFQLRTYMMLYKRERARLVYVLMNTPENLLSKWDNASEHFVKHLPLRMRFTTLDIVRDEVIENLMKERAKLYYDYALEYLDELYLKNLEPKIFNIPEIIKK